MIQNGVFTMLLLCQKEGKGERIFCIYLYFIQEVLDSRARIENGNLSHPVQYRIGYS